MKINLEDTPIDVTDHIIKFRDFLVESWESFGDLIDYHDWDEDTNFINEWPYLNWEILVERNLLQGKGFLTQFRMMVPEYHMISQQTATHTILAKPVKSLVDLRTNNPVPLDKNLRFCEFIHKSEDSSFCFPPPFDLGKLVFDAKRKRYSIPLTDQFIVPIKDLRFYLTKLEEPYV